MTQKKILLIIPTYLPILGGAELAVHNIAKSLVKSNIKADVLTFNISERWKIKGKTEIDEVEGVKVIRLGGFNLLFFLNNKYKSLLMRYFGVQIIPSLKLYKIIQDYDIIHLNDEVNLSIPFFLKFSNKKKIFHLRTFAQLYSSFLKSPFLRMVLRGVSQKFIVETHKYNSMLDKIKITPNRRVPWQKGVNTDIFKREDKIKESNDINILTIGRLSDIQKGFHVVLEAVNQLDLPVNLTFITPNYQSNEFSNQLESRIRLLTQKETLNIEIIRNVPQQKLVNHYNWADIFVFTPLQDSMPNVLLEASSCELPIISTKVGGIPNIILHEKTGILIQPDNISELVNKIKYFLDNKGIGYQYGKNARKHIIDNYSLKKAISSLVKIYENL